MIQVNGAVRGEGPDRQSSGNADSGRGEISGGNIEVLILFTSGKWRNSVFPAAKSVAKFCGEIFVLVCAHLSPPKICHRPSTGNFTASLAEFFWSVSAQFVRGSGKAGSRKFTARLRHREVWETGRSGSHRIAGEHSPVPHQSRERGSRNKLQAPWVSEHALRTFLGCLVCT